MMKNKIKLIVIFCISIVLILIQLGFSFTQAINRESSGAGVDLDTCKGSKSLVPYRVENGSQYYLCSWSSRLSAIRILIGFFGILFIVLLFIFLFKFKRFSFMFVSLFLLLCGGFGLYSTVIDGMALEKSKKYCDISMEDQENNGSECVFKTLYGTVVMNAISAIFMITSSCLSLKHRSNVFDIHGESQSLIKDDGNNASYSSTDTPSSVSATKSV